LKLAEVNIAFWVLGGEAQATNHKRASMRKQRTGKGSMKYAVILDGHPIADDRGPDRTEVRAPLLWCACVSCARVRWCVR
jgi:hypothetical protein